MILYEKDVSSYLNLEFDGSNFLKDCNKPNLDFHEISKNVNKPTNNDVSLIQKLIDQNGQMTHFSFFLYFLFHVIIKTHRHLAFYFYKF